MSTVEKLAWTKDGRSMLRAGGYVVKKSANNQWFWRYAGWSHWAPADGVQDAKRQCQHHANETRKLFE